VSKRFHMRSILPIFDYDAIFGTFDLPVPLYFAFYCYILFSLKFFFVFIWTAFFNSFAYGNTRCLLFSFYHLTFLTD